MGVWRGWCWGFGFYAGKWVNNLVVVLVFYVFFLGLGPLGLACGDESGQNGQMTLSFGYVLG